MLVFLEVGGFASITYGIWTVSHSAGFMAAGVLSCLLAFLFDRADVTLPKIQLPRLHLPKIRLPRPNLRAKVIVSARLFRDMHRR